MKTYRYLLFIISTLYIGNSYASSVAKFSLTLTLNRPAKQMIQIKHQRVAAYVIYKILSKPQALITTDKDGYFHLNKALQRINLHIDRPTYVTVPKYILDNDKVFIEPIIFSYDRSYPEKPTNILKCPSNTYPLTRSNIKVNCSL